MDTDSVELHECTDMPPRYSINEEDDSAIMFVNNSPSKGEFHLISFCPFCGERFGPADTATTRIEELVKRALNFVVTGGSSIVATDLLMGVKRVDKIDDIQVVILDPGLKDRFTAQS